MSKPLSLLAIHAMVYGLVAWANTPLPLVPALVFAGLLIWASNHDFRTFEIPDTASVLLALSGLVHAFALPRSALVDLLLGVIFWPLAFWLVAFAFRQRRGFDGLGLGDVKLMVGIGLWCGFYGTIWVVLSAALSGIALMMVLALPFRRDGPRLDQSAVAFGPFLCLSAWGVWATGIGL